MNKIHTSEALRKCTTIAEVITLINESDSELAEFTPEQLAGQYVEQEAFTLGYCGDNEEFEKQLEMLQEFNARFLFSIAFNHAVALSEERYLSSHFNTRRCQRQMLKFL